MPDRITCELASAFLDEHQEATGHVVLKSSGLLRHMRRLSKTRKESHTGLLENQNLQAKCPISTIEIGLTRTHPVLRVADYISMLSEAGRVDLLTGGADLKSSCTTFWERYRSEDPMHPVFQSHCDSLHVTLPMCVYGDEGQSHKKLPFLILSLQPILGKGTSYSIQRGNELGVNMLGDSCVTRMLYSVMKANMYNKRPDVFERLVEAFAKECHDVSISGVQVSYMGQSTTIYPVVLFCKGDWPMLKKLGHLTRTHHQGLAKRGAGKGICHLCMAGDSSYPDWHNCINGSWMCAASLEHPSPPWSSEGPFTSIIRQSPSPSQTAFFYRPDLFHVMHKGVMAELTGSAFDALMRHV